MRRGGRDSGYASSSGDGREIGEVVPRAHRGGLRRPHGLAEPRCLEIDEQGRAPDSTVDLAGDVGAAAERRRTGSASSSSASPSEARRA